MKKTVIMVSFILFCPVWAALGQQSGVQGGEPSQGAKEKDQPAQPLTNDSIVRLVKAGLGEDTIISIVNTQPGKYSLGLDDIPALRKAGAPEKVIKAMAEKAQSPQSQSLHLPLRQSPNLRGRRTAPAYRKNTDTVFSARTTALSQSGSKVSAPGT